MKKKRRLTDFLHIWSVNRFFWYYSSYFVFMECYCLDPVIQCEQGIEKNWKKH